MPTAVAEVLTSGRQVAVDLHLTQRQVPLGAAQGQGHEATLHTFREALVVGLAHTDSCHRGHPGTEEKKKTLLNVIIIIIQILPSIFYSYILLKDNRILKVPLIDTHLTKIEQINTSI